MEEPYVSRIVISLLRQEMTVPLAQVILFCKNKIAKPVIAVTHYIIIRNNYY